VPDSNSCGALDLSVIIVSWNTADELRACILSAKSAGGPNVEVIVVDNASHDGSTEMVSEGFPDVKL
jgi:GT2 family glycosyltransferase